MSAQIKVKDIKPLRDNLFEEQGGICLLCSEVISRPVLDHSHFSGNVRGVICSVCNVILGAFENATVRRGKKDQRLEIAKNLFNYISNERTEIHPSHGKKCKRKHRSSKSSSASS